MQPVEVVVLEQPQPEVGVVDRNAAAEAVVAVGKDAAAGIGDAGEPPSGQDTERVVRVMPASPTSSVRTTRPAASLWTRVLPKSSSVVVTAKKAPGSADAA